MAIIGCERALLRERERVVLKAGGGAEEGSQ